MLRRTLLAAPLLAAPAIARAQGAATAGATTSPATTIRISTAAPPSDFLAKALELIKGQAMAADPSLKIETYPAGTLFKQGTEIPALQRGNLEMSTMTTFEVAQQLPELGFLNRGYLIKDYPHLRRIFDGPFGADYVKTVVEKMGIRILATAYLGTRQVSLRKKRDVAAPADLNGVRMRMPAGPEWLLLGQAIGTSPQPMGMPEVYLAMKTGTIDGQENPLSILNAAKLYEVSEQVITTAHLIQPVFLNIAEPAWQKLAAPARQALQAACTAAAKQNDTGRLDDETSILAGLAGRGLTVTKPDLAPFRANADKVYDGSDMAKSWDKAWMKRATDA